MAGEYVFNLMRVTKQYNKVTVLDDITLAFFFGAKIGVIGGNGSGKSSLLRILGGIDKEFMGEAQIAKNMKIGYLPQEPQLDPSKMSPATSTKASPRRERSSRATTKSATSSAKSFRRTNPKS